MAVCYVCGKKRVINNNVSHSNNRTRRSVFPNLQRMRIVDSNGVKRHAHICTRCLRSGFVKKAV